jgi:hypothetical protein
MISSKSDSLSLFIANPSVSLIDNKGRVFNSSIDNSISFHLGLNIGLFWNQPYKFSHKIRGMWSSTTSTNSKISLIYKGFLLTNTPKLGLIDG